MVSKSIMFHWSVALPPGRIHESATKELIVGHEGRGGTGSTMTVAVCCACCVEQPVVVAVNVYV